MKLSKWITALVASTMLLAACGGGGGDAGTSPFGGSDGGGDGGGSTPSSSAAVVDVATSSLQIGTGANETVTITAVVKGAGSVALANEPVSITASSGALVVANARTNASGIVTAQLSAGSSAADKANRTITVTATAGNATGSVSVQVTGTSAAYSGPTSLSAGGATTAMAILVKDSKGAAISGATVTVSGSTLGNTLTSSATTDGNGSAQFNYTPTNAGSDTLVFSVLGTTVAATVVVSGQDFVFLSPSASTTVAVGANQLLRVRYRLNGAPVAGQVVTFASTAGTFAGGSSMATDGSGEATATLSSTFAGAATVTATISGVGTVSLPLSFIAETPANLVLQASPSAVGRNLNGSTTQQVTILARVTDSNGNPVQGKTVSFSRTKDPSGGNLSAPSAQTDSNGEASVKYIAGPQSTPSGGVEITASVPVTGLPDVTNTTTLTVNQSALFIALGTNNDIDNASGDTTTYVKRWTVYVTDADGGAVPGVTLTMRILPLAYGKGRLAFNDGWGYTVTDDATSTTTDLTPGEVLWCANEDVNYDGILGSGEDTNASGFLDPGNVIALAPSSRTVTTDANGSATVEIRYAESYAPWVYVALRATATVSGTEAYREADFVVSGSEDDFSSETVPPAGLNSPFGRKASCGTRF